MPQTASKKYTCPRRVTRRGTGSKRKPKRLANISPQVQNEKVRTWRVPMLFVHVCVVSVLHIAAIYVVMKKIREGKLVSTTSPTFSLQGRETFPPLKFSFCVCLSDAHV